MALVPLDQQPGGRNHVTYRDAGLGQELIGSARARQVAHGEVRDRGSRTGLAQGFHQAGALRDRGLLMVAVALELFRLIERSPRSPFSRAVLFAGRTLQRVLTTREPRSEHLDLASRALLGVIEAESASLH